MTKNKNCCDKKHPNHSKELPRLKRIAGQINGVIKMIEEERYCVDIMQQLSATKSAIHSVQAEILQSHLSNCVQDAMNSKNKKQATQKIEELKEIFKKY